MSLRINYNSSAINAHRNLQVVDRSMSLTLARLSSGVRLTRSADAPGDLILANQLRHHVLGLTQATDNVEEGMAMLNTAESGMDSIANMLLRTRELVVNALNDGTMDQNQLRALQDEFDNSVSSIDSVAKNTVYGSVRLLDGTMSGNRLSTDAKEFYKALEHDDTQLPVGIEEGSQFTIAVPSADLSRGQASSTFAGAPGLDATIQGQTQNGNVLSNLDNEVITIAGPHGSTDITLSASTTFRQFVGMVNAQADATGARAAYDTTTGELVIENTHFGGGALNVEATDVNGTGFGLLDSSPGAAGNAWLVDAPQQTIQLDYIDGEGVTQSLTLTQDVFSEGGLAFRGGAFTLWMRDTSDGSFGSTVDAPLTSHTATRANTGLVQLGALSGQTSTVELVDMRPGALGHAARNNDSGYESLQDLVDSQALLVDTDSREDALRVIDAAILEVSSQRGKTGALVSAGLESTQSTLRIAIESLTASESLLRDTDYAEESAQFARHNIVYQAATAMLAQANQLPQSVLQLLS